MDTDDICLPDRFEKQIQFIKNNPDISLLGSSTEEFDENMENSFGYRTNPTEHNAIVNYAKKKRNPFNHMTVAFKKMLFCLLEDINIIYLWKIITYG
ncbi:glycosyltransferase [Proteus mirabilis]|uniref:glycosyltransferase n=1 Tax=Proteus mirabilis TaxID=584 RepID=UPI001F22EB90|nr:glycosyltransferase [Proteus mirabilis]